MRATNWKRSGLLASFLQQRGSVGLLWVFPALAQVEMKHHPDLRSVTITLFLTALILYGSLYPFRFHPAYLPNGLFAAFWATARQRPDRGDIISNILLQL